MENKKFKTLYIHGLDSSIKQKKIEIIQYHSETVYLNINYYEEKNTYMILSNLIKKEKVNCIIGSSFGGMLAYWLGKEHNIPSLLYNPGFGKEKIINLFEKNNLNYPYNFIILGKNDTIVRPQSVLDFIDEMNEKNYDLFKIPKLGHRIDLKTFKKTVNDFYKKISL